ncbi:AraC-like DNA-binding protein [Sphingomonas sp. BE138]|uniref:helix-turn-helix transcriptional regulator n=1 Tax=Sphingomonas sp. BE138 TaxID=2817845 RepID=UPI00285B02BE|nr:AraC family transcriptional regulator [Sphingomonas sp. BE138]MDR6790667.1 AraC-like DNA-binding protein [Sphingomonas sp. BE138]
MTDHRCTMGRGGCGCSAAEDTSHLTLVRRGCFKAHVGQRQWMVSPATVVLYKAGTEFRTSHPLDKGDDSTLIALDPSLLDEAFGSVDALREFPTAPAVLARHIRLTRALQPSHGDRLAREELVLDLVRAIAETRFGLIAKAGGAGARRDRAVMTVRDCIHADVTANLSIEDLARAAGLSSFHLMHLFKSETGQTVRGYRRTVRIAEACHRIMADTASMTDIAYECGFGSHSHMTDTIRNTLGVAPRDLRRRSGLQ